MEEKLMKRKIFISLVVGFMFLNGCGTQNSKVVKKESSDNKVIAEVEENKNTKKQNEISIEEETQENDCDETKDENTSQEKIKDESADVTTNSASSNTKTSQSSTVDKSPTLTETKEEQPTASVEEQEPVQPEPEVVEPVKQDAMATEVMNQINNYRIQNGLQPLESTQYYQDKADAHAFDMASQRALWHSDNGECITNHPDPFNAWINSPEHREIILRENNTKGVVSIYYVDGYYYSVFQTSW